MTARITAPAITTTHSYAQSTSAVSRQVTIEVSDGLVTLTATGQVDRLTSATSREDLLEVWPVCVGILTVDLSGCTYLSVDAVRALQEVWRWPTRARGELRVIAGLPDVTAALDASVEEDG
ncbi:STAS domain-containing protein [Kribbella sp. NPDC056861]|uniref:STAS domain-containing protein n=1 Tax=Kribbella sp. NPDC056861 TaxID=3154857 RepID=UPI003444954D